MTAQEMSFLDRFERGRRVALFVLAVWLVLVGIAYYNMTAEEMNRLGLETVFLRAFAGVLGVVTITALFAVPLELARWLWRVVRRAVKGSTP